MRLGILDLQAVGTRLELVDGCFLLLILTNLKVVGWVPNLTFPNFITFRLGQLGLCTRLVLEFWTQACQNVSSFLGLETISAFHLEY